MCDQMQCVVTLSISDGGVGVMGDEELDDVEVSVACSPLHRCCDQISSKSIDFCPLFE